MFLFKAALFALQHKTALVLYFFWAKQIGLADCPQAGEESQKGVLLAHVCSQRIVITVICFRPQARFGVRYPARLRPIPPQDFVRVFLLPGLRCVSAKQAAPGRRHHNYQ